MGGKLGFQGFLAARTIICMCYGIHSAFQLSKINGGAAAACNTMLTGEADQQPAWKFAGLQRHSASLNGGPPNLKVIGGMHTWLTCSRLLLKAKLFSAALPGLRKVLLDLAAQKLCAPASFARANVVSRPILYHGSLLVLPVGKAISSPAPGSGVHAFSSSYPDILVKLLYLAFSLVVPGAASDSWHPAAC